MSDQFQGLPMGDLIGGPLNAAADAQVKLAQSTANFINRVGFSTDLTRSPPERKMRYVDFEFERPKELPGTGSPPGAPTVVAEKVKLTVPLLSIVPVPNLQVDTVDVTFDMEVKSSTSHKDSQDLEVGWDAKIQAGYGPISASVEVNGKVATHQENTRSSDNSAKYHVAVHATNHGMPEGLQRVWDIMASSIGPVTRQTTKRLEA
jgi:hypothetical protein